MAFLLPPSFPHDLTAKPRLNGEAEVYKALRSGLDDNWTVFYDTSIKGSRRRIDFVAVDVRRGLLAIEVKGGQVHGRAGKFRQLIRMPGQRKIIDPFRQLRWSVEALFAAAGLATDAIPLHQAIWLPDMGQAGLRWKASDHIWTRELLAAEMLRARIDTILPVTDDVVLASLIGRLIGGLAKT